MLGFIRTESDMKLLVTTVVILMAGVVCQAQPAQKNNSTGEYSGVRWAPSPDKLSHHSVLD